MTIPEKLSSLIASANNTTGKSDTNLTDGIQSLIDGYGSGGGGVIFIDYDGSIVESWPAASVASKTALPNNPTHPSLVAQGWNWSLANIKSYISKYEGSKVVVGQMYKTASGLTEFGITITRVTGLTVTCDMSGNKNWGDGTQDALTSHTYTNYGDYTITCDGTSIPRYVLGSNSTSGECIGTGVRLGDRVTSISDYAFHNCFSLINIIIPDGVTSIGSDAFDSCNSLTSIIIPDSVTGIGDDVLYDCYSIKSIIIPDSVTSIGNRAFNGCNALVNITIPDGITSIGNYTFSSCCSLTNIIIPDGVTSIGSNAFHNCFSLISIIIPDGLTSIGSNAFEYCRSLTSITIPDSVTSIGSYAFSTCSSLTSITIPDGVTSIGEYMFQYCNSLKSIIIPDSVTSIGKGVFWMCFSLTSIIIPDGVTSIGSNAFVMCYSITKYDFTAATAVPTLVNTDAFSYINNICKIVVPDALYNTWIAAARWSTYANYIYKSSEV